MQSCAQHHGKKTQHFQQNGFSTRIGASDDQRPHAIRANADIVGDNLETACTPVVQKQQGMTRLTDINHQFVAQRHRVGIQQATQTSSRQTAIQTSQGDCQRFQRLPVGMQIDRQLGDNALYFLLQGRL